MKLKNDGSFLQYFRIIETIGLVMYFFIINHSQFTGIWRIIFLGVWLGVFWVFNSISRMSYDNLLKRVEKIERKLEPTKK